MSAEQNPTPEPLTLAPNSFFIFLESVRNERCDLSVDEALTVAWRTWSSYSQFQRDVFVDTRRFDSLCHLGTKHTANLLQHKKQHTTRERRK